MMSAKKKMIWAAIGAAVVELVKQLAAVLL